jgi:hypothetical protein
MAMLQYAENSQGYAKAHGISVNDVVSANANPDKRAYGLNQVTPETAKMLGFSGDPDMLKDPKYNQQVADANLAKLVKQFGDNDPEAIAVAWNAGPARAARWIREGRRLWTLPQETQDYLLRIGKLYNGIAEPEGVPLVQTASGEPAAPPTFGRKGVEVAEEAPAHLADRPPLDERGNVVRQNPDGTVEYEQPEEHASSYEAHGTPDEIDMNSAKMAITQKNADSEVNVDPIEKQGMVERVGGKADPAELDKALPARDSAFNKGGKEALEAFNAKAREAKPEATPVEGQPHPAVAAMQALAKTEMESAEKLHFANTGIVPGEPGSFKAQIETAHAELEREDGPPALDKATEAGVRCAIQQGVG